MHHDHLESTVAVEKRGGGGYDARAVANLLLDVSADLGIEVRHIKLQKLLYFAHGMHLIQTNTPLVGGNFEAWQRGPVHPAVYRAFRPAGSEPITFRAQKENVMTGALSPIPKLDEPVAKGIVSQVVTGLGQTPDFALVALSHVEGGPWDFVVEQMKNGFALGARIDDDCLRARFFRHKWIVRPDVAQGEDLAGTKHGDNDRGIEKPYTASDRGRKSTR
jgi:uncharacterized phage-associated protein